MQNIKLIDSLEINKILSIEEFISLLSTYTDEERKYAAKRASLVSKETFGNKVFFRGLIEITNYCRNNCFYCGIRRENFRVHRYRLSKEDIFSCCEYGYKIGFRTFVLQGGEDEYFTDERVVKIIKNIKSRYSDCAVTLSLGEKQRKAYQMFFDAGADRYLLRHETATFEHYARLHPSELTFDTRQRCLYDLKSIGYQTGCGMMVGSPFQTVENIAADLLFMKKFNPAMVGIGPFIPHKDTLFRDYKAGSSKDTLFLLSLIRLMLPKVLLPATTALGTVSDNGRELGILAGANVIMPNLTPVEERKNYLLYDKKIGTADDASEDAAAIEEKLKKIGYEVAVERGDYPEMIIK